MSRFAPASTIAHTGRYSCASVHGATEIATLDADGEVVVLFTSADIDCPNAAAVAVNAAWRRITGRDEAIVDDAPRPMPWDRYGLAM